MKKHLLLLSLAVLLLRNQCHAEEKQPEQPSQYTMEEIVVTATKTEEKRKDIPNSLVIIDELDIQESPAKNLGDLLANEPGVDWRTYGNYGGASGEIHIRGMGADATQILINGVNINSPSFGSAESGRIPLNNIARIEVIKGSGSVLYGSGAMGGTVNIITKEPKHDKQELRLSTGYGSEKTSYLSAEQGMFVRGDIGYYLTASRRETDGFRDNSDLTQNDASLKLVFDKGDALDISLYGDYIDRKFGQPGVKPPDGTRDYYISGQKFYNSESASLLNHNTDEDAHMVLCLKSRPLEWLGISLKGDYSFMENYNNRRSPSAGQGNKSWVTNKVAGTEGNIDIQPFSPLKFIMGAEYRDFDYEKQGIDLNETGADMPGTETGEKHHIFSRGIFTEAQYRPLGFLKLLVGIRQENHSAFGHETLPRFGLIINPLKHTAVKLNHGKHFKAPTPNDLYWPEDDFARGNPELRPETGWHSDIGIEQSLFNDRVFVTLSYFDWDIEDKISWAPNSAYQGPWGDKWTPSNVDAYYGKGVEFGAKIRPSDNMAITLDYTYTDAEEKKKNGAERQARNTCSHQVKGGLTWWSEFGLTTAAVIRYIGKRPANYGKDTDTEPDYTMDSYWTADLRIEQRVHDHWIVSVQGNNLFNEEYNTHIGDFKDESTGKKSKQWYPGAGRSLFLSVSYEY